MQTLKPKSVRPVQFVTGLVLMLLLIIGGLYFVFHSHAASCTLAGDANCDGTVNILDLSILATNWGKTSATWSMADFNADGTVNILDLSIMASHWGSIGSSSALIVNASTVVNPFSQKMKGIGLANWTFTKNWGKPFVGDIQGLPQAIQALNPGIIRYAGGLWANWVGFDPTKTQTTPYTNWTYDGLTYSFDYGTDELASLDKFAKSVNADVMIQVNISNYDPTMWANLVTYAKQHNFTSFKYYEFGNELDLETANNGAVQVNPATYATRVAGYETAMSAADSTVKFVASASASATDVVRNSWASGGNSVSQYITQALSSSHSAGHDLDSTSYHWYQTDGGATGISSVTQWSYGILSTSTDWWKNSYSRDWSADMAPWVKNTALPSYPNTQQGISELGVNSANSEPMNGNQIGALWFSDVLGRLAYNGLNWVTEWDSYAGQVEDFSLIYPDSDSSTTPTLNLRPSYYAYLMYSKYFGDQMVQSNTYDPANISIWASKDSQDPGKLKLRITNLSANAISTPISLAGFSGTSGQAYVLSSTNPTDMTTGSDYSTAPTTINGVKLNGNDVAGSLATIQPQAVSISGSSFNYTFPAYSSTAIILTGTFQ